MLKLLEVAGVMRRISFDRYPESTLIAFQLRASLKALMHCNGVRHGRVGQDVDDALVHHGLNFPTL